MIASTAFLKGQSTGTATLEARVAQQLVFMEQELLLLCEIFIDLKNVYDTMDCEGCLKILEEYGVGHLMLRLIKFFLDHAELVCCASGVFGEPWCALRGVMQ